MADDFEEYCQECEDISTLIKHSEIACRRVEREAIKNYQKLWFGDAKKLHAQYQESTKELRKLQAKMKKHLDRRHRRRS
jgi:DNA-binding FrmR family transcriptional regulator